MAKYSLITRLDKKYILDGNWMCKASPTNAHHWIEATALDSGLFVCRYCGDTRRFPTTFTVYRDKEEE